MSDVERITITLTHEMAEAVKGAVSAGEYASNSEVVRDALREWRHKRELRARELEALRADIQVGVADVEDGRVHDFATERIVHKGRKRLARPESSE